MNTTTKTLIDAINATGDGMQLLSDVRRNYPRFGWNVVLMTALQSGHVALHANDQPHNMTNDELAASIVLDGKTYWAISIR